MPPRCWRQLPTQKIKRLHSKGLWEECGWGLRLLGQVRRLLMEETLPQTLPRSQQGV